MAVRRAKDVNVVQSPSPESSAAPVVIGLIIGAVVVGLLVWGYYYMRQPQPSPNGVQIRQPDIMDGNGSPTPGRTNPLY